MKSQFRQNCKSNEILKTRKIVFAGGGSGGHVYPLISVREEIKSLLSEQGLELEALHFVSKDKLEDHIIEAETGIKKIYIPFVGGMPRSLGAILWIFKLFFSFIFAFLELLKEKPCLIFSTGGYASAPILIAANILKIKYCLHNSDAHLGLANKAFLANASAVTFGIKPSNNTKEYPLDAPVVFTGNPIRKTFFEKQGEESRLNTLEEMGLSKERKTLLVTGGSQGAGKLNDLILSVCETLIDEGWQIIHQVGSKNFESFKQKLDAAMPKTENFKFYVLRDYFNDLSVIYDCADVIVCRAGAITLAEIEAKGLPAIIIPLPNLAQNHQVYNAKSFVESSDISVLIEQKDLSIEEFLSELRALYEKSIGKDKDIESPFHIASKEISNILIRLID